MVKRKVTVEERAFFAQFPGFNQDPSAPVTAEFTRLAAFRGWARGSLNWTRYFRRCMEAEYDRLIGVRAARLETWQQLCRKVDMDDSLPSITQCKKVGLTYSSCCCGVS